MKDVESTLLYRLVIWGAIVSYCFIVWMGW